MEDLVELSVGPLSAWGWTGIARQLVNNGLWGCSKFYLWLCVCTRKWEWEKSVSASRFGLSFSLSVSLFIPLLSLSVDSVYYLSIKSISTVPRIAWMAVIGYSSTVIDYCCLIIPLFTSFLYLLIQSVINYLLSCTSLFHSMPKSTIAFLHKLP